MGPRTNPDVPTGWGARDTGGVGGRLYLAGSPGPRMRNAPMEEEVAQQVGF